MKVTEHAIRRLAERYSDFKYCSFLKRGLFLQEAAKYCFKTTQKKSDGEVWIFRGVKLVVKDNTIVTVI